MIAIYEERRTGAQAETVEHSYASLEKYLEPIRKMDGFTCSQISIQHMDNMVMIGYIRRTALENYRKIST